MKRKALYTACVAVVTGAYAGAVVVNYIARREGRLGT